MAFVLSAGKQDLHQVFRQPKITMGVLELGVLELEVLELEVLGLVIPEQLLLQMGIPQPMVQREKPTLCSLKIIKAVCPCREKL